MNNREISQFNAVCRVLLKSEDITEVQNTDKSIKVFVNEIGVVIPKTNTVDTSYKTLTKFLNLIRKRKC